MHASDHSNSAEDTSSLTSTTNTQNIIHLVDYGLAKTMYAMRSTISAVVWVPLHYYVAYSITSPLIMEWQTILNNREATVHIRLLNVNQLWTNNDYIVGPQDDKYIKIIKGNLSS